MSNMSAKGIIETLMGHKNKSISLLKQKLEMEAERLEKFLSCLQGEADKIALIPKAGAREKYIHLDSILEGKRKLEEEFILPEAQWLGACYISGGLLIISIALGYFSITAAVGNDFIGGNTYWSTALLLLCLVFIDLLLIFILKAILSAIRFFYRGRPDKYIVTVWRVILITSTIGCVAFLVSIFLRIKEVI